MFGKVFYCLLLVFINIIKEVGKLRKFGIILKFFVNVWGYLEWVDDIIFVKFFCGCCI